MLNRILALILIGTFISVTAQGQLVEEFNPPKANSCLALTARSLADQMLDWNQLGRYHAENQELKKQSPDTNRVVFLGDSITDFWKLSECFPGKPYVNRGISGQTTSQMLVRLYPDVINLKPAAMVLLAGINDIAQNTGPQTSGMIENNIQAMTELAQHHGIKVILCSIMPVSDYPYLKQQSGQISNNIKTTKWTDSHPAGDIIKLNVWLKDFAEEVNAIYVNYFDAFVDDKGLLKESFSDDGLHPNDEGYKVMNKIIEAAIQKAIK
ncbi:MAG: SGNH/GDSL hydrolase family protein [Sedimentisphaerales bacterium]|nr:SGNH/GDSL hydrolase family protein [Sedimentisphaerales bacterium]